VSDEPGAVGQVLGMVRSLLPAVRIERLQSKYPTDDDNVWFIKSDETEVQIDTHPDGRPPFVIEGDLPGQRRETSGVSEAVELILGWLGNL
jgi:hypothetical protein